MPRPGDQHINVALTNVSVAYMQSANNFIANRVFPEVPVEKQSNQYWTYPKGGWFRGGAKLRPPASPSAGGGYVVDTAQYFCHIYAHHVPVDDQERANADAPFNLDRDAAMFNAQQLLILRENEFANTYFTTGVWGQDVSGVAATPSSTQAIHWDDYDASDPITDVQKWRTEVAGTTGFLPNVLVMGPHVLNALRNHPDILDRIKYTQRGMITAELLAAMFEVDRVLVPYAVQNSAEETVDEAEANEDIGFIYGKDALLVYAAPQAGLRQVSGGYIFKWRQFAGSNNGFRVNQFRKEDWHSDIIEAEDSWDMKLVAADVGVFFSGIVT